MGSFFSGYVLFHVGLYFYLFKLEGYDREICECVSVCVCMGTGLV